MALSQAWYVFVVVLIVVLVIQALQNFRLLEALRAMASVLTPLALAVADIHVFKDLVHLNI